MLGAVVISAAWMGIGAAILPLVVGVLAGSVADGRWYCGTDGIRAVNLQRPAFV